jgi:hypothetical protein
VKKHTPNLHGFIVKERSFKYYVTFRKKEHLYKLWNSYGISSSVLEELKLQLVDYIVIRTPEGEYIAYLWDFINSPYETTYHGDRQKHLPLSNFMYRPRPQPQPQKETEENI